MVPILSYKSLQVALIFASVGVYLILFNYMAKVFFLFAKKADFLSLFFGASYMFILKYIIFENSPLWSDIYPYFLFFFILAKLFFLKKIIKISILTVSLIVSIVYPIAFIMSAIDMTYHPYIIFLYHSFWIGIFIYSAKKLKEAENNLPRTNHRA